MSDGMLLGVDKPALSLWRRAMFDIGEETDRIGCLESEMTILTVTTERQELRERP